MSSAVSPGSGRTTVVGHLIWEGVLFLFAVLFLSLVVSKASGHSVTSSLLAQLAVVGLPTVALALSLRLGNVNLAVGAIAGTSSTLIAKLLISGWSLGTAALVVIVGGLAVGVIGGLFIGLLDAPGWAVSLGLIAILSGVLLGVTSNGSFVVAPRHSIPDDPRTVLDVLAVLFIVGSVAGGVVWLIPGVRHALGADRPAGTDVPLGRRLLLAVAGYGGSSLLAALGGVAAILYLQGGSPAGALGLPLVPLGAVLLGGVSVYGFRGGLAGTVLATFVLVGFGMLMQLHGEPSWLSSYLPAGIAILLGLGVSAIFRTVERGTTSGLQFAGYPPPPGYPPSVPGGYPLPAPGGYPPPAPGGYPPAAAPGGYPPAGYASPAGQPFGGPGAATFPPAGREEPTEPGWPAGPPR